MPRSIHHGRVLRLSHKAELTDYATNARRPMLRAPAALGSTEDLAKAASAIVYRSSREAAACNFGIRPGMDHYKRNDYALRSVEENTEVNSMSHVARTSSLRTVSVI